MFRTFSIIAMAVLGAAISGCPAPPAPSVVTPDFAVDVAYGHAPVTVKFTDKSTTAAGTLISWSWDFGDGGVSNEQNPTHTYGINGIYKVSLTAATDAASATLTRDGYIVVGDQWAKVWGASGDDVVNGVDRIPTGGFVLVGTITTAAGDEDMRLQKIAVDGSTTWTKDFGGTADDEGNGVVVAANGDIYAVGTTRSTGAGGQDVYVVRVDLNGSLIWEKTFGGQFNDRGAAIRLAGTGAFIIGGDTESFGAQHSDGYLIKIADTGVPAWSKVMGSPGTDEIRDVRAASDGSFLLVGNTTGVGSTQSDIYVIKTDKDGKLLWSKTYGGLGDDSGEAALEDGAKGFWICGYINSLSFTGTDAGLLHIDKDGKQLVQKIYGSAAREEAHAIIAGTGTDLILVGSTASGTAGGNDVYIVDLKADLTVRWARKIGGPQDDVANTALLLGDSGVLAAGWTKSFGAGAADWYAIRTTSDGYGPGTP